MMVVVVERLGEVVGRPWRGDRRLTTPLERASLYLLLKPPRKELHSPALDAVAMVRARGLGLVFRVFYFPSYQGGGNPHV